MIECVCNNINTQKVKHAVQHHRHFSCKSVFAHYNTCAQCGKCGKHIHALIKEFAEKMEDAPDVEKLAENCGCD